MTHLNLTRAAFITAVGLVMLALALVVTQQAGVAAQGDRAIASASTCQTVAQGEEAEDYYVVGCSGLY